MKEGNGSGVVEPVGNAEVLKFGAVESARSILSTRSFAMVICRLVRS